MKNIRKQSSIIPGFGLSLGYTVVYVSLLVLFPLSVLVLSTSSLSWDQFLSIVLADRVIASYKLSFLAALGAALVNTVFGLLIAWVLVRYRFPGKKILDGLVDLPFALPTAVAGISLTAVYAPNGWIGQYIEPLGIKVAFTSLGITIAFIFIGIPFVIRTVQPVLHDVDRQMEEAAASLGATRWVTFWRVIFPQLVPALLTGFTLALARAVGEYGSVVFISGNMPMKTEITPLLIMTKLEQFDYAGATAIASVMLLLSFVILLLTNILQWWSRRMYRMDI
ncbi:sulfate ABC transporter permease subunit CysT [Brevibacillus laterosporus]|uniref:sulfate ABC transporter permease subunit CysT n=1 Tax=Brevibacillus TaxID=55080 RepID=UPI0002405074|nr:MULTISPECIES: sulfate ABC transporter permease subunit CysT [Brevibacillus]AUM63373.1 sulfate ABC transporter permease subunit CysT [Brevibacillus laterosporus]MCR8964874.1 sulfate ABC transporter permease subunit CysT [Brevibacillus laterosporus]MCZ0837029.1 sulfate ABC transporter permease subunit CysT [Brevibacillus halotolerans]MDF9412202.1 sulfate ABC transporter permease subunit CysT [Brevibacillus laterosporus]CCF15237.1 sulfate ABC transporter, permease protein CysT [Brevibacillus l